MYGPISDYWKAYDILEDIDYTHLKVNHSIEFKNSDGDHTNKIEGHWRHAKTSFPSFGTTKTQFESYLASFMWRYQNKGKDLFMQFISDVASLSHDSEEDVSPPNTVASLPDTAALPGIVPVSTRHL